MTSYRRGDVVLVVVPFADFSNWKARPAVVVSAPHTSRDEVLVALSSRVTALAVGEFVVSDWAKAGLNVPSKVKRFVLTVEDSRIARRIGVLSETSKSQLDESLTLWLGLRIRH
jgi:mRNA interferase MazF